MPRPALPLRPVGIALATAALALAFFAATLAAAPEGASAKRKKSAAGIHKLADARVVARPSGCARASQRKLLSKRARSSADKRQRACGRKAVPAAPSGPIYWGAWIGNQLTGDEAPWDMSAVAKFEGMAGKGASVINFSSPFADCSRNPCDYYEFPEGPMDLIRDHGSIPMFSWASQSTPAKLDQPNFQLSDVLQGHHDAYIREWAEDARDWGHPFFLRFNWEMNGNWFAWHEGVNGNQPGEAVAVWRHVHDIFDSAGADNVTWVWCPNIDPTGKMRDLASLYPGDEYVDWTGLDGYNWGTNPARPDKWRSFDELYRTTYDEITTTIAPGKPLIISEIGSTEFGGSKADWIADTIESVTTEYPLIRGFLWFEKYDDGMDWPIETSSASAQAFATGIQHPAFTTNAFGSAASGPIAPLG
jgi:mannan endo-1,4-beta-mannosidase